MPFNPSSPNSQNVSVQSVVPKDLDTIQVSRLLITEDMNNPSATSAHVFWDVGYMDNGTFKAVKYENFKATVANSTLGAILAAATNDGESIYAAIKRAVWELLTTTDDPNTPGEKLVGAGTVV